MKKVNIVTFTTNSVASLSIFEVDENGLAYIGAGYFAQFNKESSRFEVTKPVVSEDYLIDYLLESKVSFKIIEAERQDIDASTMLNKGNMDEIFMISRVMAAQLDS